MSKMLWKISYIENSERIDYSLQDKYMKETLTALRASKNVHNIKLGKLFITVSNRNKFSYRLSKKYGLTDHYE